MSLRFVADRPPSFFSFFLRMNYRFITQTLAGVMEGGRGVRYGSDLQSQQSLTMLLLLLFLLTCVLMVYKNGISIQMNGHTQWVKLVKVTPIQFCMMLF